MDPRPYHFQYRKPRLTNPTYQSANFYDSIHQLGSTNNQSDSPFKNGPRATNFESIKRSNSSEIQNKKYIQIQNIGTYRYNNKQTNQSKIANYGSNLIRNSSMQQDQIFNKQERLYNIINNNTKEARPTLRNFPKLTAENKMNNQSFQFNFNET